MENATPPFTRAEKMAIFQAVDSVILADGIVHQGEIGALGQLMHRIGFETNFMIQARSIDAQQGIRVLVGMTKNKKQDLIMILKDIAKSDGFVHEKEVALMLRIFAEIGIKG